MYQWAFLIFLYLLGSLFINVLFSDLSNRDCQLLSPFFGIGFSLFVVGIAALNLVLDFDFIEQGSEKGLPQHMEWYGAFSLMVTLVWLYLEILRLLAKLRSN